jgi:hypothetical protein
MMTPRGPQLLDFDDAQTMSEITLESNEVIEQDDADSIAH